MDGMEKRSRKSPGAGSGPGPAKVPRRTKQNKNGLKVKEEKISPVGGPDPGGGCNSGMLGMSQGPGSNLNNPNGSLLDSLDGSSSVPTPSSKGCLPDDLLNGTDIKLEPPSTPQLLDSKGMDCNSGMGDMPPLSDLGHHDFPDCKPQMNPYGYGGPSHYGNMPPHPGDYGPPHSHGHGPPLPHMMGGYGPPPNHGGPPPPPPHGGGSQQPPHSTKQQPSTMEAQYMQQQSQIFVFSTTLANKAAEAVYNGQFPTIISFHTNQPTTRKFLEFQGNPNNWPNNPPPPMGKMGKGAKNQQQQQQQQQSQPPPSMIPPGGPGGPPPQNMPPDFNPPPCNMYNPNNGKSSQQGYPNYYDGGYCGGPPPGQGQGGPMGPNMIGPGTGGPGGPPYFAGGPQSNRLAGIKVRDEDLTPEQRHHREEKLAKLRQIQQVLIPDNENPGTPGNEQNCHPMPQHENMEGYMPPGGPPSCPMMMDYMHGPGGQLSNKNQPGNEWSPASGNNFFMEGHGMKPGSLPPHGMGPSGNGPRSVKGGGGGSIPSPATPLTPGSSCGAPHRPSPHSPMPGDPLYPGSGGGHSFYPSGYFSPQIGQLQDTSPSGGLQRKDSESSNSEGGGKNRKDKNSCSVSPTSSAPPSVKEANLMPVPSPQQIQYLNNFEGQELTIQKQPNMGLSEHTNEQSPGLSSSNLEMNPLTPNLNQQKPSHSAPPTPVSMNSSNPKLTPEVSMNNSSAKGRPGSVGPVPTPKGSTTPNPSPQGLDRNSQPGTPLQQMNMMEMKQGGGIPGGPGGFMVPPPGSGNVPQPPCGMMKGMNPIMDGMDGGGPGSGGVFDNLPLNPNLGGPAPPGNKTAFDPISSMAQMSQQLTGGNGTPPNPPGGGMNNNGGYGMNSSGGPGMSNMVNFNTSMHQVQSVDGGMAMGGPQTVNNTYVNATMTIQQMNIQNMPPYMNHPHGQGMGPNMGGPNMPMGGHMGHMQPMSGPPPPGMQGPPNMQNQMGPGGPNSMPMGQHGMGPMGPGPGMCGPGPMRGPNGPPPQMVYGNQPPPQRMGGQGVRGGPYRMPNNPGGSRAFGGTNIQVKPNAPNTIQYLPARPPPPHNQGSMCPQPGMVGPGGPQRGGPNLDFLQRYTNPSPGPVVNVNMGINVNVNMQNRMGYPGPPGQQGMSNNGPPCGPMRGPHPMMDQGPNAQQSLPPNMMSGPGMKGMPPGQGYPGPQGMPPNGPGPGPGPNDPAYAQQFHHFQQQLYATGSNSNGGRNPNLPPNLHNNPNQGPGGNPQFFK